MFSIASSNVAIGNATTRHYFNVSNTDVTLARADGNASVLKVGTVSGNGAALTSLNLGNAYGTLAVANGGTGVSSSTGSGSCVLNVAPVLQGTVTVSGNVAASVGSASAPSYAFVSDGDTGVYSPSGNVVSVAAGATEQARFHYANMTTVRHLTVNSTLTADTAFYGNSTAYAAARFANITAGPAVFNGDGSKYVSGGGLRLSGQDLTATPATGAVIEIEGGRAPNGSAQGSEIRFYTSGSQRAAIDKDGYFQLGTSSTLSENTGLLVRTNAFDRFRVMGDVDGTKGNAVVRFGSSEATFQSANNTLLMYMKDVAGRASIGLNTYGPDSSATLHVQGNVKVTNTINFGSPGVSNTYICLWGDTYDPNSYAHYGFGVNSYTLRYQVTASDNYHKFYGGSTLFATIAAQTIFYGTVGVVGQITGASGSTTSFYSVGTSGTYNMFGIAGNDVGNGLVMFVNGSGRSADGGVNTCTIRNDIGTLRLGHESYTTWIAGNNVGVGTSSPSWKFHVQGDGYFAGWVRTEGVNGWYNQTYQGGWYMADTSWIRVYNSKNVLAPGYYIQSDSGNFFVNSRINLRGDAPTITFRDTNNYVAHIHCNSGIFYVLRGATDTDYGGWATVNGYWPLEINLGNNDAKFGGSITLPVGSLNTTYVNDTDSYKNRLVFGFNSFYYSSVTGGHYFLDDADNSVITMWVTKAGNFAITGQGTKPGGGSWASSSDARIKKNVQTANLALCHDIIRSLPLQSFDYTEEYLEKNPAVKDRHQLGWIAQDVEKVFPKSVYVAEEDIFGYAADFRLKLLDVDQILKVAVGALQHLVDRVDALEKNTPAMS